MRVLWGPAVLKAVVERASVLALRREDFGSGGAEGTRLPAVLTLSR